MLSQQPHEEQRGRVILHILHMMKPSFPHLSFKGLVGTCRWNFLEPTQSNFTMYMTHLTDGVPARSSPWKDAINHLLPHFSVVSTLYFLYIYMVYHIFWGFSIGTDSKESAYNVADPALIPGSGRFPGEGNGNPLQYSCLEKSIDWGGCWVIVHGLQWVWRD